MATMIQSGEHHEIWQETNPALFDGGASVVLRTQVRGGRLNLDKTQVTLFLKNVTGTPIVADPVVTDVGGYIQVSFANTAAAGNMAAADAA